MKYAQINEIYKKFSDEKVITGIKNPNIIIKYINPYLGIILPLALVIGGSNLLIPMKIMNFSQLAINSVFIVIMILALFIFLCQNYTLYFRDNNIILKNKLNKRKILDVNNFPRIYIRYIETDSYNTANNNYYTSKNYKLHLQQNNTDISFNIELLGSKKLNLLLDNLQMKNRKDVTLDQWQSSTTKKDKTFSDYSKFLNQQIRITGVKNPNLNLKIMNNKNLKLKLIICFTLTVIGYLVSFIVNNPDVSNVLLTLSTFLILADLFLVILIAEKWKNLSIKISYPSNSTIKINKNIFDYKKNNVMLSIKPHINPKSTNKYDYSLVICCNNRYDFSIDLNLKQESQLSDFIYNLNFQEKSTN